MTSTDTAKRLEDAKRREAEATAELEKQQRRIRDLTITGHLEHDHGFQKAARQVLEAKDALHKHRLRMGRKRFSIRCKERDMELTRAAMGKLEEQEKKILAELAQFQERLEQHKDGVAQRVKSKLRA